MLKIQSLSLSLIAQPSGDCVRSVMESVWCATPTCDRALSFVSVTSVTTAHTRVAAPSVVDPASLTHTTARSVPYKKKM